MSIVEFMTAVSKMRSSFQRFRTFYEALGETEKEELMSMWAKAYAPVDEVFVSQAIFSVALDENQPRSGEGFLRKVRVLALEKQRGNEVIQSGSTDSHTQKCVERAQSLRERLGLAPLDNPTKVCSRKRAMEIAHELHTAGVLNDRGLDFATEYAKEAPVEVA